MHIGTQVKNKMAIGTLPVTGLVVNFTDFIMTTSVGVRKDKHGNLTWTVEKRASPPEFIGNILKKLVHPAGYGGERMPAIQTL